MKHYKFKKIAQKCFWISRISLLSFFSLSIMPMADGLAQGAGLIHDITNPNVQEIDSNTSGSSTASVTITSIPPNSSTEISHAKEYARHYNTKLVGSIPSQQNISKELCQLGKKSGTRPAVIYTREDKGQLILELVLPDNQCITSDTISKEIDKYFIIDNFKLTFKGIQDQVRAFRKEIVNPTKDTTNLQAKAKVLHNILIAPLQPYLRRNNIDTLVFSMAKGLRALPFAALHDGQQYLVQEYNLALIPSFSLVDTRYRPIREAELLAMGISEFPTLKSLPSAEEINAIRSQWPAGQSFLEQDVNRNRLRKLTKQNKYRMIHLSTHARFNPTGDREDASISLWEDEKIKLSDLGDVILKPKHNVNPIELLVLSACKTALGRTDAELGFSGSAYRLGVKTVLGSLWDADAIGTLALMNEFYFHLQKTSPTRAAALRQAQLTLLDDEKTRIVNGSLQTPAGTVLLPPDIVEAWKQADLPLSHPYFWSSFTMVGNWN